MEVGAGPLERFRNLIESYDLTGDEDCSFADLGIDSLALAELRTDLQAVLEEHGAGELADEVNTRLLQRLTVAEFFGLMRQFGEGSGQPLDALRRALDQISADYEAYETAQMRADAALPLPELAPARAGAPTDILLTGATGFWGRSWWAACSAGRRTTCTRWCGPPTPRTVWTVSSRRCAAPSSGRRRSRRRSGRGCG